MIYWKKFGIIFLIAALVIEIADYLMALIVCPAMNASCRLPLRIVEAPILAFGLISNLFIITSLAILFWFVIGAIAGLIYGMIKSRPVNAGSKEQKLEKAIEREILRRMREEKDERTIKYYKGEIQKLKEEREKLIQEAKAKKLKRRAEAKSKNKR